MRLIIVLMCVYLALTAGLAVAFDRRFFLNDALAIVVFAGLLSWLFFAARPGGRPR